MTTPIPRRRRLGLLALGAHLPIALAACTGSATGGHPGGQNTELKIAPATATVEEGRTAQFTAASPWGGDVLWSVLPTTCGTISSSGLFTPAARTYDTCTVAAVLRANVRYTATASVTVVPAAPASPHGHDRVFASGGLGTSVGGLRNAAVLGEPVAPGGATSASGTVRARHGFMPSGAP